MEKDMEVWKEEFQKRIQEKKPWHTWALSVDKEPPPHTLLPGCSQYQQCAFARFQCSLCSRHWASAQVCVLFHIHWSQQERKGQVQMNIFGQKCRKCPRAPFEVPEFTGENISRVLNNLVSYILKRCYREGFHSELPTIVEIPLEGPHDSVNCEACAQGICAKSRTGLSKTDNDEFSQYGSHTSLTSLFHSAQMPTQINLDPKVCGLLVCCLFIIIVAIIILALTVWS